MNREIGQNEDYEHRIIRVPADYRIANKLCVGDFIHLRNRDGHHEAFQVSEAFKEDVAADSMSAYVTTSVYDRVVSEAPKKEVNLVTGITLGCDPEVFLVDRVTGNILAAYRYLPKNGPVGHDGLMMEFRPNPSVSAAEVCYNLWKLIQQARNTFDKKPEGPRVTIVAGSSYGGMTAGFHLHYGLPRGLLGRRPGTFSMAKLMTNVFDYYIGVPSILPEGNRDVARRTAKHIRYGKPGEYRLDHRTFEFRMPGGINMTHPILAQGLMSLGAVVAQDIASRVNTCTDCFTNLREVGSALDMRELYPNLPEVGEFYATICNPDIGRARNHFEIIKNDVRQMVGYVDRAEDIEAYFEILDRDIVFGNNIEHNWGGIYNARQQGEMVVL
jgi:hypothetical protein